MAITNFQFPGVELHQEFVATPVVGVSQLGVAIIGQADTVPSTAPALELGTVTSVNDIVEQLGDIIVATTTEGTTTYHVNKMALACYLALSAAPGYPVYYVLIKESGSDGSDFVQAIDFLAKYPEIYSIVPLTTNATKLKACLTAVVNDSEDAESKIRRTLWCGVTTTGATAAAATTNIISAKAAIVGSGATGAYRCQVVWSPGAVYGGQAIPADCLAAAPAGMRSYEPSYRPISNLGYSSFSVSDTLGFTRTQLEQIGAQGVWIIDSNFDGTPVNKKQVTAEASDNLNKTEESIVANIDSIALTLCHVGEDIVGNSNISPVLLKVLSDTITNIMDQYLINSTGNAYVGPQLLSWSLDALYQDPVVLDHVYAVITCEPPKPFNRFIMTVRVV
jgi:hypothetical protein